MSSQKWAIMIISLAFIGTAAGVLIQTRANQKLGEPGVLTVPIEGSKNLKVALPASALDYSSVEREPDEIVTNTLPRDTSYGTRVYTAADGFQVQVNVVLMGVDRTSLHKPQFCLEGAGLRITETSPDRVSIDKPHPYDLPVIKILVTKQIKNGDQLLTRNGVYVYWFVADGEISSDSSGLRRMISSARTLLTQGVLQRWAYISYYAECVPGEEAATYERMKELIAATVPEYQLTTPASASVASLE